MYTSTASNALGKFKSAMLQHARENHHHFRKEDITILSSEQDWVKRGIKEALFIKTLKPSINIDPGRHALSSHFDSILQPLITAPPPPPTHISSEALINTAPRRQGRPRRQPSAADLPVITTQDEQRQTQQQTLPKRQSQRLMERQQQHSQH